MAVGSGTAASVRAEVATPHPEYMARAGEWLVMRDTARGATAVYAAGGTYLPMPSGFAAQPDGGIAMYAAYMTRAQFPEVVGPTVVGMIGVVCRVDVEIDMPPTMDYLWEDSDGEGLPLEGLHRKIVEEVLTTGRYVLLADAPVGGGQPYLTGYVAENMINWSRDRDLFVLSEARLEREGDYAWHMEARWRVLRLVDGKYETQVYDDDGDEVEAATQPAAVGAKPLKSIPLVVVNARDTDVATDNAPLLGVARSALAIYRLDADYRHQLFMSGQETLCITGVGDASDIPSTVGAGVIIILPKDASAHYLSPSCSGITAHEKAIAAETARAAQLGAQLFDAKAGVESGDALRIRRGAQVASLIGIAQAVSQGLEMSLRNIADMLGEDRKKVVVKPNLDFIDATLSPADAMQLVAMWQSGAISYQTLYENLQRGEIASYERDAADERELMAQEPPVGGGGAPGAGGGPAAPQPSDQAAPSQQDLSSMFDPSLLGSSRFVEDGSGLNVA